MNRWNNFSSNTSLKDMLFGLIGFFISDTTLSATLKGTASLTQC